METIQPAGFIKPSNTLHFNGLKMATRFTLLPFTLRESPKSKGPMTWVEFSKAIHARFGPTDYEDPGEALSRLEQTTTVVAYQEEFERLSHRVDDLPEHFLIGCFVGGLKDEIRLEVKVKSPRSLADAIGMARLVEQKLNLGRVSKSSEEPITTGLLGPPPTPRLALPASNQVRRLTSAEIRDRHAKGLCYYCDETYKPGHKCSKPQLMMIVDATDNSNFHLEDKVDPTYPFGVPTLGVVAYGVVAWTKGVPTATNIAVTNELGVVAYVTYQMGEHNPKD